MTKTEAYLAILEANGLTRKSAAELLGYAGQQTIGKYINVGVSYKNIEELLKALDGYKIVIERGKGKKAERYEIEF